MLYNGIVKKRKQAISLLKNHPLSVFGSEFCFKDIVPISYQPSHTFTPQIYLGKIRRMRPFPRALEVVICVLVAGGSVSRHSGNTCALLSDF